MIPFRYQLLGHLAVGLFLAFLLNIALAPAAAGPDVEEPAPPFTTQPDMLAVTIAVYTDTAPEILDVQPLEAGRVSVTQPGPYGLVVEDEAGKRLYELSFRVAFAIPGLHEEVDEVRQIFVVPAGDEAYRLVLAGPNGEAVYRLQPVE